MTHTELRHQIQDIIKNISHRDFLKPIFIRDLEPQGYAVGFGLIQYAPLWYSAELPDDQFLIFIEKELRNANFLKFDYSVAKRFTTIDRPLNNFKSYDPRRVDGKNG